MVGDFRLERKFSDYKSLVLTFELISLMVGHREYDSRTSALKVRCATNCANDPYIIIIEGEADYNAACQGKGKGERELYRYNGRWHQRFDLNENLTVLETAMLSNYTTLIYNSLYLISGTPRTHQQIPLPPLIG